VTERERHAEAHRLKNELSYGARRIAKELGITRHAATQLLARPLPQPVAEVAPAVAEPVAAVAEVAAPVDGQPQAVAEPTRPVADKVAGHLAALVGDGPASGRRLVIDLDRFPGLAEDLALLQETGADADEVVNFAVDKLASVYRTARAHGCLRPRQPFQVLSMQLKPVDVPPQTRPEGAAAEDATAAARARGWPRPGHALRELSARLKSAALVRRAA
jgi:hypothetical protein